MTNSCAHMLVTAQTQRVLQPANLEATCKPHRHEGETERQTVQVRLTCDKLHSIHDRRCARRRRPTNRTLIPRVRNVHVSHMQSGTWLPHQVHGRIHIDKLCPLKAITSTTKQTGLRTHTKSMSANLATQFLDVCAPSCNANEHVSQMTPCPRLATCFPTTSTSSRKPITGQRRSHE